MAASFNCKLSVCVCVRARMTIQKQDRIWKMNTQKNEKTDCFRGRLFAPLRHSGIITATTTEMAYELLIKRIPQPFWATKKKKRGGKTHTHSLQKTVSDRPAAHRLSFGSVRPHISWLATTKCSLGLTAVSQTDRQLVVFLDATADGKK